MIIETKKNFISKIIIFLIAISAFFGALYFYSQPRLEFKDFNKDRDSAFVKKAFARDMYWLVENPEFELDYLMANMAPNKNPEYLGKLNFKILFENDKQAGFTTYYKEKFYQGKIQFIYVDPEFRNKGYSKKLTHYAAKALFEMGVSVVIIVARVSNTAAIKAYKSVGFKEVYNDGQFIDFSIVKDQLKKA